MAIDGVELQHKFLKVSNQKNFEKKIKSKFFRMAVFICFFSFSSWFCVLNNQIKNCFSSKFKSVQPCCENGYHFQICLVHANIHLKSFHFNDEWNWRNIKMRSDALTLLCCHGPLISAQYLILDLICWSWLWMIKK